MTYFPSDTAGNHDAFRDIDLAFARLMQRLAPQDPAGVGLAALLVSRASGEGHVCIDLDAWAGKEIRLPHDRESGRRCPTLDDWRIQLHASPLVDRAAGRRPLVCDARGRVYLQRLYQHEQNLAQALQRKADAALPAAVAEGRDRLQFLLNRYFEAPTTGGATNWQKIAAVVALIKRLCIISGAPGTGKTTTVARILAVLLDFMKKDDLRVHVCAPTGKAAARLADSLAEASRSLDAPREVSAALAALAPCTIHRLLRAQSDGRGFFYNETNPLPTDLVVVDEASMVDLVLMSRLVGAVPEEARLLILGDKDQLASVEAGSVFGDLCRDAALGAYSPGMRDSMALLAGPPPLSPAADQPGITTPLGDCLVVLHKNYRFDPREGIGALTRAVNSGNGNRVKQVFAQNTDASVRWEPWQNRHDFHKILAAQALKGYEIFLAGKGPAEALARFRSFMILCALASGPFGVERINSIVADLLQKARLISRNRPWYPGRPVMITRNSYRAGLFNGDTGLAWPDADGRLRVWFEGQGGELRALSPQRLPEHRTVFAMTVHKSQGSEFDRALLVLPDRDAPVLTRELVYTGCSRARRQLILAAREDILDVAVSRTIQRTSGLSEALWQREGSIES